MADAEAANKRQKTNGGAEGDVGHYFDAVGLPSKIPFEGPASRNPLAFKYVRVHTRTHTTHASRVRRASRYISTVRRIYTCIKTPKPPKSIPTQPH